MNELAASLFGSQSLVAPLGGERGCLGAASSYQRAVEQTRQQRSILPDGLGLLGGSTRVIPELTRFDPSTKTRVPVTQEWVDEAVAEIVRLNQEIELRNASRAIMAAVETSQFMENLPIPSGMLERIAVLVDLEPDTTEQDRIWEAVRAASAV